MALCETFYNIYLLAIVFLNQLSVPLLLSIVCMMVVLCCWLWNNFPLWDNKDIIDLSVYMKKIEKKSSVTFR